MKAETTWAKLKDVCDTTSGGTPSRDVADYYGGDVPWVKSGELLDGLILDTEEKITKAGLTNSSAKLFPTGTLLIALYGATVGKLGILGIDATTNQAVCGIKPNQRIDRDFLFYYLLKQREKLIDSRTGGAQPNISQEIIRELDIPLPPLTEQKQITSLLRRADRLRQLRRTGQELSDSMLQSVFLEMFGDPITNKEGWDKAEIGDLVSDVRGGAPLEPEDFRVDGFPVLHKGAIKPWGGIELDPRKRTFTHDSFVRKYSRAVINRSYVAVTLRDLVPSGPSIGLVSKLTTGPYAQYILAQGAYAFLVDKKHLNADYLMALSNMASFRKFLRTIAVGSTQIHIRTPIYMEISIPLPPISLQEKFSDVVGVLERLRDQCRESARQSEMLFQDLMNETFTQGIYEE